VTYRYNGSAWVTFNTIAPFTVQTTATTVNGVTVNPGVYMDAAYIKDGTITNAKIGNLAVDDAKIGNISATKITAGFLDAARIDSGSITSDKISVTSLAAITTDTGNLSVSGRIRANTAAIDGTTMTGSGGEINSDGTFAFGNATTNVLFDGSNLYLNGMAYLASANSGIVGIGPSTRETGHFIITFTTAGITATKPLQVNVSGIISLQAESNSVAAMEGTLELRIYDNAGNIVDLLRSVDYVLPAYLVTSVFGSITRYAYAFVNLYFQRSYLAAGTYKIGLYTVNEKYYNSSGALLSSSLLTTSAYGFQGFTGLYQAKI
jgi:hypothetical protein